MSDNIHKSLQVWGALYCVLFLPMGLFGYLVGGKELFLMLAFILPISMLILGVWVGALIGVLFWSCE